MSKIIYWAAFPSDFYLNCEEPKPVVRDLKQLYETTTIHRLHTSFIRCPCIHEHLKNTFTINSPIDLTFTWDGNTIYTKDYNQMTFDKLFELRDVHAGLISLNLSQYIFFTEYDCDMTVTGAYMSNNDMSKYSTVLPGRVNISKWFRNTDLALFIREKNKEITIKKGDPLMYVKFHTDERIKLQKFYLTNEIYELQKHVLKQKEFQTDKSVTRYLKSIYNTFNNSKIKSKILSEINKNLMD